MFLSVKVQSLYKNITNTSYILCKTYVNIFFSVVIIIINN